MVSKAWKHRLKYHHPRIKSYIWRRIVLGPTMQATPRCTFAELGSECPVVKELSK